MFEYANSSYKDVTQLPEKFLQIDQDKVRIPAKTGVRSQLFLILVKSGI